MRYIICGLFLVCCLLTTAAWADVTIVDETFDSYADESALESVWRPDVGDGRSPTAGPVGILVPRSVAPFPPAPFDGTGVATAVPPVDPVVGQAVTFSYFGGSVMEWDNDNDPNNFPFELIPSEEQSVRYAADIFDSAALEILDLGGLPITNANRRFSVGLRNDTVLDRDPGTFGNQTGLNFLEMGYYNATATDPTDPNDPPAEIVSTGYAYRVVLFGTPGGDLLRNPNWLYFELPAEFDDPIVDHNGDGKLGNGDGVVNASDVGPGWHRFTATVTPTDVTLELDLFRDGTVDASQTWTIAMNAVPGTSDIAPFSSLRMGGPSGISMNQYTMVDNVKLELVDVTSAVDGDFNADGAWDCADIDALTAAIAMASTDLSFDMNGDGAVTLADITAADTGWLAVGGANNPDDTGGNPFLEGDANLDGSVDVSDFNIWNGAKFTPTAAWCSGDFNASGGVDVSDFNVWNGNKFQSSSGPAAVPEPASALLLVLSGGLLLLPRRRG